MKKSVQRSLVLMRHGESESNLVHDFFKEGNSHPKEAELMAVHTSVRRLTPLGIEQAQAAGTWLRDNWMPPPPYVGKVFGFVSPYARAKETAGNLGLDIVWKIDDLLVERNWGMLDRMTYEQRIEKLGSTSNDAEDHEFFWRPSDGETLQDVQMRVFRFLDKFWSMPGSIHALVVTHGETLRVFRKILEGWDIHEFAEHSKKRDPKTSSLNCRIVEYEMNGVTPYFDRARYVNPMAPSDLATNRGWQFLKSERTYSSDALLSYVEEFPHFLREDVK